MVRDISSVTFSLACVSIQFFLFSFEFLCCVTELCVWVGSGHKFGFTKPTELNLTVILSYDHNNLCNWWFYMCMCFFFSFSSEFQRFSTHFLSFVSSFTRFLSLLTSMLIIWSVQCFGITWKCFFFQLNLWIV